MILELDTCTVDLTDGTITRKGSVAHLSRDEAAVFRRLVESTGKPVTGTALQALAAMSQPALKALISRLRRKVGKETILTVRGQGWLYRGPDPVSTQLTRVTPLTEGRFLDVAEGVVLLPDGQNVELTQLERGLLRHLVEAGGPVSRLMLLREVWGVPHSANVRSVDNTVYRLRQKLGPEVVLSVPQGLALGGTHQPKQSTIMPSLDTPFFGRTAELRALDKALQASRLVSLVGMGGSGKTTLAKHYAAEQSVVFCGLQSAGDDASFFQALATTLACSPAAVGGALQALGQTLLILDNLEQLEASAALVQRVLDSAPELKVLCTTRLALGLGGERQIPLGPLDHDDAVALYVERAQAFGSVATEAEAHQVVARLDGWPLAITFVAARARLGVAALTRSPQRMGLGEVLTWSWKQTEHQQALAALSLFEDGFDLDDIIAVSGLEGDPLMVIEQWMKAGWLHNADGPLPLRLLIPVRAFLKDKLSVDRGEEARRRHLTHMMGWLSEIGLFHLHAYKKPPHIVARLGDLIPLAEFALVHQPELLSWLLMPMLIVDGPSVHDLATQGLNARPDDGWLVFLRERSVPTAPPTTLRCMSEVQARAEAAGDQHLAMIAWYRQVQVHLDGGELERMDALLANPCVSDDQDGVFYLSQARFWQAVVEGRLREALDLDADVFGGFGARKWAAIQIQVELGDLDDAAKQLTSMGLGNVWSERSVRQRITMARILRLQGEQSRAAEKLRWLEQRWTTEDSVRLDLLHQLAPALLPEDPHGAARVTDEALELAHRFESPTEVQRTRSVGIPVAMALNDREQVRLLVTELLPEGDTRGPGLAWLAFCGLGLAWLGDDRAHGVLAKAKAAAEASDLQPRSEVMLTLAQAAALLG